jgi:membrane protein YdbS with pleckstrin-like domain
MSSKPKKQDKKAAPIGNLWRSGRSRFGLNEIRFGKDRKWHFPGQQPDETVTKIVREHWWFLVLSALPLLVTLILFILAVWASGKLANPIWPFLELIIVILIIGALGWFIWKDFIKWYLKAYIITNERIVIYAGVFELTRKSIPLEKVQQVGVDIETLWGFILRYGTVHVYLVGGDFIMKNVPRPKRVKEAIDDISESIKANKPKEVKPPMPDHPEVAALIGDLSRLKDLPKLENADEQYKLRNPGKRLAPMRTFGGILRIRSKVRYSSGEFTVKYIQRSQYVFYRLIAIPILAICIVLSSGIYIPTLSIPFVTSGLSEWWAGIGTIILLLFLSIGAIYANYADDLYILSNKRVIDIQRRFVFFFEERRELDYKNIKDIQVKVPNVVQRLLDIGDVYIEVAGAPSIVLKTIDHPLIVLEKINEIKNYVAKVDDIKKENELKKELHKWFGNVVTGLVVTSQGAPNLVNLDLIDAMERANEKGFQVTVYGEEPSTRPDIPPGRVVHQSPPAGTVIQPGGEIQVVLSRKATTADLMNY